MVIVDVKELETYLKRLLDFVKAEHEYGSEVFVDITVRFRPKPIDRSSISEETAKGGD